MLHLLKENDRLRTTIAKTSALRAHRRVIVQAEPSLNHLS
jgi:hypothetical protein